MEEPVFFEDIDRGFCSAGARDPWWGHYSRIIENQLDVGHLPFVRHNPIGRGGRTLVDGPALTRVSPTMVMVYPSNRRDDGRPPIRPRDFVVDPGVPFKLEFISPNIWQNSIDEQVRIVAAFVPVVAEKAIPYLRFYQKVLRVPFLRALLNRLAMSFNLYVAHQDRRVVETHQPLASGIRIGERLIHGDHPIVEYRKRRAELLSETHHERSTRRKAGAIGLSGSDRDPLRVAYPVEGMPLGLQGRL